MKKFLLVAVAIVAISSLSLAQLKLNGVGGTVGYASVSFNGGSSTESLGGFAIAAHADLGEFTPGFALFPEIQYFSTSKDLSGGTWKMSDFAINANVHYNIAMEGGMKPYVGAGLGYNSISTTVTIPTVVTPFGSYGGEITGSASRIGINLLAGVNYKLNDQLTVVFEPRYVLASDFNHLLIKAGVTYALPQ